MIQPNDSQTHKDPVFELNQALDSGSLYQVRQMLKTLPTAGIAHLLESSPPKTRSVLWQLVDKESEGEVIQYLNEDLQNDILSELNAAQVFELTEGLETDDIANILQQLPLQITGEVLQAMDQQDRDRMVTILAFDEDTAGGLMNTDTITVRRNHTIEFVLRYLRRHDRIPEMTDNLLVVSREDQFLGILPSARHIGIRPSNYCTRDHERGYRSHKGLICPLLRWLSYSSNTIGFSAPVVDETGKLLGRITIDDVVDVIRDSAEHSLMSMAGLDEEDDTFAPVFKTARRRALWLGVNLMTAVFASFVIYLFQDTLDQVVYLCSANAHCREYGCASQERRRSPLLYV